MGNPFLRSEVNDIGRAVVNTCLMRVKIAAAVADSQGNYSDAEIRSSSGAFVEA
jgi:hypothetical protein